MALKFWTTGALPASPATPCINWRGCPTDQPGTQHDSSLSFRRNIRAGLVQLRTGEINAADRLHALFDQKLLDPSFHQGDNRRTRREKRGRFGEDAQRTAPVQGN